MASPDTAKPASGLSAGPVSKIEQVGTELVPSNTPKPAELQAPDISGESDYAFFSRRPGIDSRIRLPFPDEFPVCVLLPGRPAFVRVWMIQRDPDGRPLRRRRALRFCKGGTA